MYPFPMTRTYRITSANGELLGIIPVADMAAVKALVDANPGAKIKAHAAITNPCTKHPAFESDNCPGCGTAAHIN